MVAKRRGISSATESSLRHHFHPRGVWPEDFRESHTLTVLGDGLVAYCHARNIGVGYDGRRDALCSHALVLASDAFKEHGYDTRIPDPLHPGSRRVRGELPAVEIVQGGPPSPKLGRVSGARSSTAKRVGRADFVGLLGGQKPRRSGGDGDARGPYDGSCGMPRPSSRRNPAQKAGMVRSRWQA